MQTQSLSQLKPGLGQGESVGISRAATLLNLEGASAAYISIPEAASKLWGRRQHVKVQISFVLRSRSDGSIGILIDLLELTSAGRSYSSDPSHLPMIRSALISMYGYL